MSNTPKIQPPVDRDKEQMITNLREAKKLVDAGGADWIGIVCVSLSGNASYISHGRPNVSVMTILGAIGCLHARLQSNQLKAEDQAAQSKNGLVIPPKARLQ